MYAHLWCDRAGRPGNCVPRSFGYGEAVAGNEVASDHQAGLAGLAESLDRLLQSPGLRRAGYRASRPGRRLGANGAIFISLAVLVFCTVLVRYFRRLPWPARGLPAYGTDAGSHDAHPATAGPAGQQARPPADAA